MCHLSQENSAQYTAHECEGKSCLIFIDGLDFYKYKAEKVIVLTIICWDLNYQSHDKRMLFECKYFCNIEKINIAFSQIFVRSHAKDKRGI